MPSDITLTSALQNNLQSLQKTKGVAAVRDNPPADGNTSVQEAICTAAQDFCTQNLSNRASELTQLLEHISHSIKALEKASGGITEITSIIREAETLALEAQKSGAAAGSDQVLAALVDRINSVVNDAAQAGANLLAGDELKTAFGDNVRNAIITEGLDLSSEAFGFEDLSFATPAAISESIEIIRGALDDTQSLRLTVTGDLKDIQTRQDFAQETISTLETGKNDINITALSDEGANLMALQTRMAISASSFSLASQTQEDVLRLF